MRVCVVGAGAIGGLLAARLHSAGEDVTVVARGAHLAAIRTNGLKLIAADGWYRIKAKSGHRQYKHPLKPGRVTVAGKPSDDLAPGTLNSILKQSGLKVKQ
jgi:predicted RNA binding protein YcfA (HicA-like mRNA interferase family)